MAPGCRVAGTEPGVMTLIAILFPTPNGVELFSQEATLCKESQDFMAIFYFLLRNLTSK
jgi:hypothetical protein